MKQDKGYSGGKIQSIASAVFIIGVVISVIVGLVPLALMSILQGFSLIAFLIVVVVGCLISWVVSEILRGFGEMVENVAESTALLEEMKEIQLKSTSAPVKKQVKCEKCGTMNYYANRTCVSCGQELGN